MIDNDNLYREKMVRMVTEDPYLKQLYSLKERTISIFPPKILFNLITCKLEYVHENDTLQKIDKEIKARYSYLLSLIKEL
jgi:hypothetical protein